MAGFGSIGEWCDAITNGQVVHSTFRKVPSQNGPGAGGWCDLSMAAGNPPPNYYASDPLVGATLSSLKGIYHGVDQAPAQKHLVDFSLTATVAAFVGQFKLMDYLLYYPFIDLDTTDAQPFDNPIALPRYSDGNGVLAMLVCAAPTTGGGSFTFDYLNQDGVAKTSPSQIYSASSYGITNLLTQQPAISGTGGPFLQLASGDTGIRSITGWTNLVSNGGLGTAVLVKPLADFATREIATTSEQTFVDRRPGPPRIWDGAHLNLICAPNGSLGANTIVGSARFAWN
jgi:hypothetical protein